MRYFNRFHFFLTPDWTIRPWSVNNTLAHTPDWRLASYTTSSWKEVAWEVWTEHSPEVLLADFANLSGIFLFKLFPLHAKGTACVHRWHEHSSCLVCLQKWKVTVLLLLGCLAWWHIPSKCIEKPWQALLILFPELGGMVASCDVNAANSEFDGQLLPATSLQLIKDSNHLVFMTIAYFGKTVVFCTYLWPRCLFPKRFTPPTLWSYTVASQHNYITVKILVSATWGT